VRLRSPEVPGFWSSNGDVSNCWIVIARNPEEP
jgi:hypothetical protein